MTPIEYQSRKTWTTSQLAEVYGIKSESIRNNLKQSTTYFIANKDFYVLEGQELRSIGQIYSSLIPQNQSKVFLWTISGAFRHAEALNRLDAWRGFKSLVDIYTSSNDTAALDDNRQITAYLKRIEYSAKEASSKAVELFVLVLERISKLEENLKINVRKTDSMASDIAIQLNLYTRSNLPHSHLVGAIAKALNMPVRVQEKYEDENIYIVPDQSNVDGYWQVYYKPAGILKITDWFTQNRDLIYFVDYYKKDCKGGKKGEIKGQGYKINGRKFWLRA